MSGYRENFTSFFHWFAWSIACVASFFFILFFFNDDLSVILAGKGKEVLLFLPGLVFAVAGCITTFFRKIPGGIMMLTGGIYMVGVIYFQSVAHDYRMMIIYGFPYIFPGILFIFVRK
jgi:hypothetical protein